MDFAGSIAALFGWVDANLVSLFPTGVRRNRSDQTQNGAVGATPNQLASKFLETTRVRVHIRTREDDPHFKSDQCTPWLVQDEGERQQRKSTLIFFLNKFCEEVGIKEPPLPPTLIMTQLVDNLIEASGGKGSDKGFEGERS